MSIRTAERKFYAWTFGIRERLFSPILKLLAKSGVKPNHITYLRGVLFVALVAYPLFVQGDLVRATIAYVFVFWLLDMFDGQLARHLKLSSDKGKFNDIFIDNLGYSIYFVGLAFLGVAGTFIIMFHVIAQATVHIAAIAYRNQNTKSDWVIKTEANVFYFKLLSHTVVFVYLIFGITLIDPLLALINIWMGIEALYYFVQLQREAYNPNN